MKKLKETKKGAGDMLWPFRVALSGQKASPDPFEIANILGKEKVINRVLFAISNLENKS